MKRIVSILLVAVMSVLIFAGCGPKATTSETKTPENTAGAEAGASGSVSDTKNKGDGKDHTFTVGFVNLSDADENCYLATKTFIDIVKSDDFKKKLGLIKMLKSSLWIVT
jgi:hypothetical protein